ncbi:MAG TPA: peptidylprolyl isomerase [Chitinophagaceae bacterium]|nr:peptidylprolyl isomerase [Chitinophagaceae bacterium]
MKLTLLIISLLCGSLAFAQPKKVVADKIIAIVGDKPVLKSDVTNSLADAQRQGEPVPENAECILVVKMLVQKALMFQAEKDSLPLAEEDVEAEMENRIRYYISAYGGKEALEQIAQKSVYQIKEDSRPGIREQKLALMMRNKIVDEVKISPTEVRAYYEKIPKDSLHFYESEVEIGEIVLYPKASRDLEKYAIEELNEYKRDVESGKQRFETLASLFTDDPGSKQTGGLYNLNRTEKNWDPTFLSTAFRLKKPGDVSNVIKSKFGYHIIQLVARNGDDATVRHILKIPQVTGAETEEATKKLDSVRANLIAGTISFGAAVSKYTDDENAKYTGGMRPPVTIDQLDKGLVLMLKDLKVGEYSKPVAFTDERQKKGIRIVYLKSKSEPHRENLADDFDRVKQRALTEKQNDALEKWFAAKIPTYYIMLDDDLKSCPELSLWAQGANMVRH